MILIKLKEDETIEKVVKKALKYIKNRRKYGTFTVEYGLEKFYVIDPSDQRLFKWFKKNYTAHKISRKD